MYLYNTWESETGNYIAPNNVDVTTLIVNPTPTITGNFLLNGNSVQTLPNTYQLTPQLNAQYGSAWNSVTLDLSQPFNFNVDIYLGSQDANGADGMAFVLQQVSTSIGSQGGGIGYATISPSFGVEFDTWQNGNRADPWFDHIAIQKDGDLDHSGPNNLVPPTGFPPLLSNIEDGLWHNVIFSWNPTTYNFIVVFDGTPLINYNNDIVANIFGNNPNVYWGFTAATGGANNLQQFRVNSLSVELSDSTICYYDTIQVHPQINNSSYSYLWTPDYNISDNTIPPPLFSPDTTTTYFLEITNSYGCSFIDSFTIFVNPSPVIISNVDSLSCHGYQDGSIDVSVAGFTGTPDYSWTGPNGFTSTNEDISFLAAGTYNLTVTATDECSTSEEFIVYEPPMLDTNFTVVDVSCYGGSDGYIAVEILSSMLSPLQYTYFIDGVENMDPPPYDTVFDNLAQGVYQLSILDNLTSCTVFKHISISAPVFPLQVLSENTVSVCDYSSEGSAVAYAAGGSPFSDGSYIFEWFSDSQGTNSLGVGDSIDGLSVGTYYLEVTDSNSCDEFVSVSVVVPQLPLAISPQLFAVPCKGDSTGSAIVYGTGGFAPYDFEWTTLSGTVLQTSLDVTTYDTLFNLLAGDYKLEVTDAAGCIENIIFNIMEPITAMNIDDILVVDSNDCYGGIEGRAWVYASGGQAGYSYLWDNGDTDYLADSLTGGWHSVEVIDSWGCKLDTSVYIPENSLIESELIIVNSISCYDASDGEIVITTQGGNPDGNGQYHYQWSTGLIGVGADQINSLVHGTYHVITRDDLGCTVIDSITISQPDPLYVVGQEILRASCYGTSDAQASAYGVGGTEPYSFVWTGTSQMEDTVNTLAAGLTDVILTDSRGCIDSVEVMIHQPDELILSIDTMIYAYCVGVNSASISVSAQGGTMPYSYLWDDNSLAPQTTATASNLEAGFYTVIITDDRGCTVTESLIDISSEIESFNLVIESLGPAGNSVSCYGSNDASLSVSVDPLSSSVAPYTYLWSSPGFSSNNATITNLSAAVYSITVTDANNCSSTYNDTITEPSPLRYEVLSTTPASCLGSCDGEIKIYYEGGVAPYFANGQPDFNDLIGGPFPVNNDSIISGVCTGSYFVTLIDGNECLATLIANGSNQAVLSASIPTTQATIATNNIPILCNGDSTGDLIALNPNLSAGYSYQWTDLNTGNVTLGDSLLDIPIGTYILSALYTDSFSACTTTDTIIVNQFGVINSLSSIVHVDCDGNSTGSINTLTQGGAAPYNYSWSNGATNDTIDNLSNGTYTLNITDANNCEQTESYIVTEPSPLQLAIDSLQTYILTPTISGGTPPYSYSWRKQPQNNFEIGIGSTYTVGSYGSYYVIVTDINGCEITSNIITYIETVNPNGILDLSSLDINIYPNPFKEQTTIDFGRVINTAELRIYDVLGKLLNEYKIKDVDRFILERQEKVNGVYFMEVEIDKNISIMQLILH